MSPDRCTKCRQLTTEFILTPISAKDRTLSKAHIIRHYQTFTELEASAASGCSLCRLLRRAVIHSEGDAANIQSRTDIAIHRLEHPNGSPFLQLFLSDGDETCMYRIYDSKKKKGEAGVKPVLTFQPNNRDAHLETLARETIKPWVDTCTLGPQVKGSPTHLSCGILHGGTSAHLQGGKARLPTRVLDIGSDMNSLRLFVPELDQGSAVFADYLILSYCWGQGNVTARTTKDNFEKRRNHIDPADLPQTILDAISVCKAVGQRFLFVDAICIIQHNFGEDPTDWLKEAPLMGQYYQNALFTIAAAAASDSRAGFLCERPAEFYSVAPVSLGTWSNPALPGKKPREILLHPSLPLWVNDVAEAPLYTRGWTLQERALSNRILHFGRDAVYWECAELRASEFLPEGLGSRVSTNAALEVVVEIHQQLDSLQKCSREEALGREWFRLASSYCKMDFTYNTDRLMAIQGIVDRVGLFFPDRYVAGCFYSQLIPSLAWFVGGTNVHGKTENDLVAPSWSWISATMPAHFVYASSTSWDSSHPNPWEVEAEVVSLEDFSINPNLVSSSSTSMGALEIKGYARTLDLVQTGEEDFPNVVHAAALSSDGYFVEVKIYLDHVRYYPTDTEASFYLLSVLVRVGYDGSLTRGCLALLPSAPSGSTAPYKRIGWAEVVEPPNSSG